MISGVPDGKTGVQASWGGLACNEATIELCCLTVTNVNGTCRTTETQQTFFFFFLSPFFFFLLFFTFFFSLTLSIRMIACSSVGLCAVCRPRCVQADSTRRENSAEKTHLELGKKFTTQNQFRPGFQCLCSLEHKCQVYEPKKKKREKKSGTEDTAVIVSCKARAG